MVEFALLAPLFLLVVFASIDYGGYFGSRLSVENAARAGARVAAIEPCSGSNCSSYAGSAVVTAITSHANVELVPNDVDCLWQGTYLTPLSYPPFKLPSSQTACIGIWYFQLNGSKAPSLCIQWSVEDRQFGLYSSGGTWTAEAPPAGCVQPDSNLVVVGVGYQYSPYTPLPSIANGALVTYGETQLIEEQ